MRLRPIDTRDIPPEARVKSSRNLPPRTYEAALITFMDGKYDAVEVSEPAVTKMAMRHGFDDAISKNGFPCKCIMRDGNIYLIKTI